MKNETLMLDYIAILFGDFNSPQKVYNVMMGVTPVVESENLKFNYNDVSVICHFQSQESQEEIYTFIKNSLGDLVGMFFISETKNISTFMNDELSNHLMNLEENNNANMIIDIDKIRKGQNGLLEQDLINIPFVVDSTEDEEVDDDIELLRKKPIVPSLDQILDKIHIYGYDTLTSIERNLLNTYSK
jgi:hypothetical protein